MNRTALTIASICLLVVVPISSFIAVNDPDEDSVDITISISGLPFDKQKIRLTKQQADEIEVLFDTLNSNLKQATLINKTRGRFERVLISIIFILYLLFFVRGGHVSWGL